MKIAGFLILIGLGVFLLANGIDQKIEPFKETPHWIFNPISIAFGAVALAGAFLLYRKS